MACARGCCETQAEHYRSLHAANPDRDRLTKTTVDDHGTHQVDVTEHYADRQDVTVKPPTVPVGITPTGLKG